jgi:site-specific DNA-methyltransferase (adenine-specific)
MLPDSGAGGAMMTLPVPYFQDDSVTIYHADCRDILPLLPKVDLVLTDPPYPDFNNEHGKDWEYVDITTLPELGVQSYWFWPCTRDFPLDWTARHVWHKPNGQSEQHYEFIYERLGKKTCRVFRYPIINYQTLPEWTPHPSQKPIKLVKALVLLTKAQLILDPFMGSGTTLRAAKDLGRKAIGIEIEEKYCAIAAKRMSQSVMSL